MSDWQYDQNGYAVPMQVPQYGANPWTALTQQSNQSMNQATQAQAQNQPKYEANLAGLQSQQAQLQNNYPTFPNSLGLGNQNALSAPQAPPLQATSPEMKSTAQPDITARGFNPYSLIGEANTR